jgi:hypothetical protein
VDEGTIKEIQNRVDTGYAWHAIPGILGRKDFIESYV